MVYIIVGTSNLPNQIEAANVPLPECDDEDLEQKIYTQENIDVSLPQV